MVKNGVIHACLKTKGKKSQRGTIQVVGSAKQCKKKKGEQALTWSTAGPTGATDPQGERGAPAVVENTLEGTIVQQSKTIELLTNEVKTLTGDVVTPNGTVKGVEDTLSGVGQTVDGLDKTVGDTVKGLTTLEGTVGNLEGTVGGLGTKVSFLPVVPGTPRPRPADPSQQLRQARRARMRGGPLHVAARAGTQFFGVMRKSATTSA